MQLLYLQSEEYPGLKQYIENKKYLTHEIIHKQMGLIANNIIREILHEIRETDMYAIIGDEASDFSLKEQLCICIYWVDNNFNIYEAPLELINVPKTNSNRLTALIKDCLV